MNRVIITGPTGAIGIAMADRLCRQGCQVYAVCRPGSENIGNLKRHENLHILECDISRLGDLKDQLEPGFDAFYHLAWNGTFGDSRNAVELQLKNIEYTLDAATLARELDCRVFVGAGSQAEFGHFREPAGEQTPTKPFSLYGAAKLSAGQMSRVHAGNIGLEHIWVRIFSVYGPGDDSRTLVSYLITELSAGRSPELTAGEQVWDYLYSDDAAEALILIGEKGKDGRIYSLGSGEKRLLKDYILEIRDVVNPAAEPGLGKRPYGKDQVMFLSADITDLVRDTGFSPKHAFKEGIREIIEEGETRIGN